MIRIFTICLLIVSSAGFLYASGSGEPADAVKSIIRESDDTPLPELTLSTLKGPTGIGMVRLLESPLTTGGSAVVRTEVVNTPQIMVSRILSGETDMASLPTNLAAVLHARGVDYTLAAVTGYGLLYMVTSSPDIEEIEDLRGKTIQNVGKGSTPEFIFRYILESNGLDVEKDISVDFSMNQVELSQSLIAGRAETAVLPEPFVTMVLQKNRDFRIVLDLQEEWAGIQNSGSTYPMSCVVVRNEVLSEHPDAVREILRRYEESVQWVNDNPEAAGEMVFESGLGIPAEVTTAAVPRLKLNFVPAADAMQELQRYYQVLYRFDPKAVGGILPGEDFYAK